MLNYHSDVWGCATITGIHRLAHLIEILVQFLNRQQQIKDFRVSKISGGSHEARNTIKGHCRVSADATGLSVPPQGHVLKTDQPVWFVCAVTDCRSTKASKSVTEAQLPSGPVVPSHRAPILSPSSRLFGTTRSGSCTQSSEIKVYLCQGANRPNSLERGGGKVVVVGGVTKKIL